MPAKRLWERHIQLRLSWPTSGGWRWNCTTTSDAQLSPAPTVYRRFATVFDRALPHATAPNGVPATQIWGLESSCWAYAAARAIQAAYAKVVETDLTRSPQQPRIPPQPILPPPRPSPRFSPRPLMGVRSSQGGSCWAYAAAKAVQGAYAKLKETDDDVFPSGTRLSVQQLVDCTGTAASCRGGYPEAALQYAAKFGLQSETEYEYTGVGGKCSTKKDADKWNTSMYEQVPLPGPLFLVCCSLFLITSVLPLPPLPPLTPLHRSQQRWNISMYEQAPLPGPLGLILALQKQPVIVTIRASSQDFIDYSEGIYQGWDCYSPVGEVWGDTQGQGLRATATATNNTGLLDHVMLAVGYNYDSPGSFYNYFILKNSWGPQWGENGYMRIRMEGGAFGTCGMLVNRGLYPVVNGAMGSNPAQFSRFSLVPLFSSLLFPPIPLASPPEHGPCSISLCGGGTSRQTTDPCGTSPCGGGTCVADGSGNGKYTCQCSDLLAPAVNRDGTPTCTIACSLRPSSIDLTSCPPPAPPTQAMSAACCLTSHAPLGDAVHLSSTKQHPSLTRPPVCSMLPNSTYPVSFPPPLSHPPSPPLPPFPVDVCSILPNNPCAVGQCINSGDGGYSCICPPNYKASVLASGQTTCVPGERREEEDLCERGQLLNISIPSSAQVCRVRYTVTQVGAYMFPSCVTFLPGAFHVSSVHYKLPGALHVPLSPSLRIPFLIPLRRMQQQRAADAAAQSCDAINDRFGIDVTTINPSLDCTSLTSNQQVRRVGSRALSLVCQGGGCGVRSSGLESLHQLPAGQPVSHLRPSPFTVPRSFLPSPQICIQVGDAVSGAADYNLCTNYQPANQWVTCASIVSTYGMTWLDLYRLNPGINCDTLSALTASEVTMGGSGSGNRNVAPKLWA
ncbi:unnamed protein product [Closterium sp. Naga37s-1]|nr:unnamed protein product [Closterium sp. Naga37s-1]